MHKESNAKQIWKQQHNTQTLIGWFILWIPYESRNKKKAKRKHSYAKNMRIFSYRSRADARRFGHENNTNEMPTPEFRCVGRYDVEMNSKQRQRQQQQQQHLNEIKYLLILLLSIRISCAQILDCVSFSPLFWFSFSYSGPFNSNWIFNEYHAALKIINFTLINRCFIPFHSLRFLRFSHHENAFRFSMLPNEA